MNVQADEVLDDIETETETTITDADPDAPADEDRGDNLVPEAAPATAATPAATPAEGDDEAAAQAARMIPKSRFDEVNNAKKLAEQDNARLLAEIEALKKGGDPEAKGAAPAEQEAADAAESIADLERQKYAATMDGDEEKVVELSMKINGIIRAESKRDALHEIKQETVQAETEQAVGSAARAVVSKYPAFDDTHADANEAAIDELVELRDYYITAKGMAPAEAITKAGEKVAAMFGLVKDPAAPAIDPRTTAAIKRGAAITEAQPNAGAVGVGTRQDAGKVNIADMDEDQFDALPEAEKRRLRGD